LSPGARPSVLESPAARLPHVAWDGPKRIILRRNPCAAPCCALTRPAASSACSFHSEGPAMMCRRAAPHLLQQAAAALPSHRSCAGSPSRPLGRASQAPARQGRGQPAHPPAIQSPASEAAECQRAPQDVVAGAPMSASRPVPRPHGPGHARPTKRAVAAAAAAATTSPAPSPGGRAARPLFSSGAVIISLYVTNCWTLLPRALPSRGQAPSAALCTVQGGRRCQWAGLSLPYRPSQAW
jgi:hypothetical protein